MDPNTSHHIARGIEEYRSWPLWAQILLPLASLTLWIPLYFSLQMIAESTCWRRRQGHPTDLESQRPRRTVPKGGAVEQRS